MSGALNAIPQSLGTNDAPVMSAKFSFVVGLGIFVLLLPFCRVKGSNWNVGSARRVVAIVRTLAFLEMVCLCVLLYQYIETGSPISFHSALAYGNGGNWVYGFGRPTCGLILIAFGMFADMHPITRIFCISGTFVEILGDCLSAYQIHDYINQVNRFNAPKNGYSVYGLWVYYWRDIVSIGICTCLGFFLVYLFCMLGCCLPQLIHPAVISGNFYDRFGQMYRGRSRRKFMEASKIIESPPPPLVPRKTLQKKIEEQFLNRQQQELLAAKQQQSQRPEFKEGQAEDKYQTSSELDLENGLESKEDFKVMDVGSSSSSRIAESKYTGDGSKAKSQLDRTALINDVEASQAKDDDEPFF